MNRADENSDDESEVSIRRRRLPHWAYKDSIYFLTWRLHKDQQELVPQERDLVAGVLKHFDAKRYRLFSYVIMNDHVHILITPKGSQILQKIIHSWKSYTANRLQREFGRKGKIWEDEYHDRIIRNEQEFYETVRYILNNPRKRWSIENYPWVWFWQQEDGGHGGPPPE